MTYSVVRRWPLILASLFLWNVWLVDSMTDLSGQQTVPEREPLLFSPQTHNGERQQQQQQKGNENHHQQQRRTNEEVCNEILYRDFYTTDLVEAYQPCQCLFPDFPVEIVTEETADQSGERQTQEATDDDDDEILVECRYHYCPSCDEAAGICGIQVSKHAYGRFSLEELSSEYCMTYTRGRTDAVCVTMNHAHLSDHFSCKVHVEGQGDCNSCTPSICVGEHNDYLDLSYDCSNIENGTAVDYCNYSQEDINPGSALVGFLNTFEFSSCYYGTIPDDLLDKKEDELSPSSSHAANPSYAMSFFLSFLLTLTTVMLGSTMV